jgi:hypothetical protein
VGIDGELAAADLPSYHGCINCIVDFIWSILELWNANFGGKMP